MSPILSVRNLSRNFGAIKAVDDVSFDLAKGELLALIGPNGAGKSTCFNMLMGQLKPSSGTVQLMGKNIAGMQPRKIWRMGVGRTFQITATYASMTVVENVQMALMSHHKRLYSLTTFAHKLYREEALANDPILLLMDEPTAGMAPRERIALMQLTADILEQRGISVLFTEHDMDVVFAHSHRIMVLNRGQLIADGTVDEIRNNPQVQEVYLGGGTLFKAQEDANA